VAIGILMALGFALLLAAAFRAPSSQETRSVNVTGLVFKSGADIVYMEVNFTSTTRNATYLATVFSGVYHIALPGGDVYTVTLLVHFVGYPKPWEYSAGTLALGANVTAVRRDLSF